MHERDTIYVLIKGIHHQSHHEHETSANQQGMPCEISQIKYVDHTDFENKISIPSGRAGSTRKRHGALLL